jgi:hypothetical protein
MIADFPFSMDRRPYCFGLPERSHINQRDPEKYPTGWCDSCNHFIDCQEANRDSLTILTLNLKETYFKQIAAGTKTEEYRMANDYWMKRLHGKQIDVIEICNKYPPRGDVNNRMWFKYGGFTLKVIEWDNDGETNDGMTFIIPLKTRLDYPYQAIERLRRNPK